MSNEKLKDSQWKRVVEILQEELLSLKESGLKYWDIRMMETEVEGYSCQNQNSNSYSSSDKGFGLRLLIKDPQNGKWGWGFASSNCLDEEVVLKTIENAMDTGKASALLGKSDYTFEASQEIGVFHSGCEINPFSLSIQEKQDYVADLESLLQGEGVCATMVFLSFQNIRKQFMNSHGADFFQNHWITGGAMSTSILKDGEVFTRGYPNCFGNYEAGGWEVIERYNMKEMASVLLSDARAISIAEECPSEIADVVIGPQMMGLTIHEVCGHATEMDRILKEEAAYAGTSFLNPEMVNHFQYGSEKVNIVSDPTYKGSVGCYGWDDEGTPANCQYLIEKGVLKGLLTGKENCDLINRPSASAFRSTNYDRMPINRMTSVNFLPGTELTAEEIIASVKKGYYLDSFCGWSINSDRNGFRFSVEIFREIKDGKLGKWYKNGSFSTQDTPSFFNKCFAVSKDKPFIAGYNNCAKGQPPQTILVGHVMPIATGFHQVRVGK